MSKFIRIGFGKPHRSYVINQQGEVQNRSVYDPVRVVWFQKDNDGLPQTDLCLATVFRYPDFAKGMYPVFFNTGGSFDIIDQPVKTAEHCDE